MYVGRLSAADAWYLYLEGPTVHLHVTGLLLLDPSTAPDRFSFDSLRSFIEGRLHLMPVLRKRLVEVPMSIDHPTWIDDPDFDLDDHLHHRAMDGSASADDLAELVGEFASTPLRRDQPLWDMVFVDGLEGDGVAVAMKMHHCIVDGVSGMDQGVIAIRRALADCGKQWSDMQFAVGGSMDGGAADTMVSRIGLTGLPFTNVLNGCATGGTALAQAINTIESGAAGRRSTSRQLYPDCQSLE